MSMTKTDKQALRRLAKKAISEEGSTWWSEGHLASDYGLALHKADAKFIAAASPATVLALLDELEKTQAQSSKWCEAFHKAVSVGARYEERIAELEARKVAVKQFDDFQIVHYGGSEDYAKGYIDCQNNYNKALTAAGIGVKGE